MRCPAEFYTASPRPYDGLPELQYPWHDRDILVTACGRICMHRKKINISTVLAGQKLGIREVDDGIWLVSFMHYDLGYIVSAPYIYLYLGVVIGDCLTAESNGWTHVGH